MNRERKIRYTFKDGDKFHMPIFTLQEIESGLMLEVLKRTGLTLTGHLISRDSWTGLTDKNGTEIYEGDIVRTPMSNICEIRWCKVTEMTPSPPPFRSMDMFQYTGFAAFNIKQDKAYHLDDNISNGEIIGNVHQNPELLTP